MEVILISLDYQGHLTPILQLAKRLAWKTHGSIKITLATTLSTAQKMKTNTNHNNHIHSIATCTIYDDTDDAAIKFMARVQKFKAEASVQLARLLTTKSESKCMLIYDGNLSWALDVAKENNVPAAAIFPQACSYVASFFPLFLEDFGEDHQHPVVAAADAHSIPPLLVELPSREIIERGVLNIHVQFTNSDELVPPVTTTGGGNKKPLHPVIRMVISQMTNLHLADWVLFFSFDELEHEVVKWMGNLWNVRTVGPLLPSAYLDKRVEYDVDYGVNLYKPNNEACMNWLNSKPPASVVYCSFGSAGCLSVKQMAELADALKQIPSNFLWIVKETEQKKLPKDFITETSNKGLVMSWCSQLDVLAHEAVGCFITHSGWNSVVEALSFGVPMLGMPQFMDHFLDAHLIDQVWGVGITTKANDNKIVTCQEIKRCFDEIVHGQRSEKIKENAAKWKALAKEAVDEGGTSDKHIDEIIAWLASS